MRSLTQIEKEIVNEIVSYYMIDEIPQTEKGFLEELPQMAVDSALNLKGEVPNDKVDILISTLLDIKEQSHPVIIEINRLSLVGWNREPYWSILNKLFGLIAENLKDSKNNILNEEEKASMLTEAQVSSFLGSVLGFTPEEGQGNPELVEAKLEERWQTVKSFLNNAISADESQQAQAREQMRELKEVFEKHGFEVSDEVEAIPERLHQKYHAEHASEPASISNSLQRLANAVEKASKSMTDYLQKEVDKLSQEEE